MKKQILLISLLFLALTSFAQGGGFNYKALLTEGDNPISNQSVTVQFTVLENGTTNVYQETHDTTTDANGIVAVNIGEGNVVSGDFTTINWGSNPYYLKVEIDSGGGYDDFGTTEFKAVPYAKYAKYAESGGSVKELNDLSDAKTWANSFFIGYHAGLENTTGQNNTGMGTWALENNTTGGANTAYGSSALKFNTEGWYNTANGVAALIGNTTGSHNTANGVHALSCNTTGYSNVAIGTHALFKNTVRSNLVAVGDSALYNNGINASGDFQAKYNTAIGSKALYANTKGYDNTASGYLALQKNTIGAYNTANGSSALQNNTTGSNNIAFGYQAGRSNETGSGNIFIGKQAGYNETGSNKLYIENSDSATPLIGGDFANDYVNINGKMLVGGNTNPTGRLQVIPGNLNNGGTIDMSAAGLLIGTPENGIALDSNQIEQVGHDLFLNYNSDTDVIIAQGGGHVKIVGGINPQDKLVVGNTADSTAVKIIAKDGYKSRLKLFEGNDYGFEFEYDGEHDELNLWSKKYAGSEAIRTKWYKNGNVEINGKLTSEATGDANLKPFAYGNIEWDVPSQTVYIKNDTGNFNAYMDSQGVFQIRLFDNDGNEVAFNFDNFTVVATVYYNGPVNISYHIYSNRLYFKLYALNSTDVESISAPFSFIVYKK